MGDNIFQDLKTKEISRKKFLKTFSVLSAAGIISSCERKLVDESEVFETTEQLKKTVPASLSGGQWRNAPCWHNCGGRCVLQAYVKDGSIRRLKTDDSHEDSFDFPQQRACARGLAQKRQVIGVDRLKYPMIRTNFDPQGKTGKELRGRDTWERISWDEALDLLADQLERIKTNYGNESIYVPDGGEMSRTISAFGGYVSKYGSRSRGAWQSAMKPITGVSQKRHLLNDRLDMLNSKLVVLWGINPAENSGGSTILNLKRVKEKGIKIIALDPMYSTTAAIYADEYIPIRPATDTTLILAIAYVLLIEDEKQGGLIDWDFLNRCTVGFDSDHMPEGADPKENFKDYVLGTYDGQPKNPEWASKICGVPIETIKSFAIELGKSKPATILFGWNSARVEKATHVCLAQVALGAMTGNMGIKGGACSVSSQETSLNGGPSIVKIGKDSWEDIENPVKVRLCTNEHWQAILTNEFINEEGEKEDIDIKMIYHSHAAVLNQTNNINKGIEAHRKLDFVVTNHFVMTPEAQYSDLVLPVTTPWEKDGEVLYGNKEILIWSENIIDPIFEARDDIWIASELAKRLGINHTLIEPSTLRQKNFEIVASSTVMKEDGEYENLVSITKSDIEELGVEGQTQEGRIPILEFKKKGIYQVPRSEGDGFSYIHNKNFREDPENNPLETASGKLEIHCQELADQVTKAGWNVGNPIAIYEPPTEGYEATFADFENEIKGKYPLQIYAIHSYRGTHTVFDQVDWLRETFTYELIMNPIDAKQRNLKENDTVRAYNDRGSLLRRVHITERVMPGVVVIHEGPWVNLDEDGNCIAGSPNILTGDFPSGPDIESWNACIVEIEKHSKEINLDIEFDKSVLL